MMDAALHGCSGIALAYAAVQAPMIAGLIRARAANEARSQGFMGADHD
jgi:hypothetical protein